MFKNWQNTYFQRWSLVKLSSSLLAGLLLLGAVFACRSSSSSAASCTGAVTYEGKTFSGEARNADDAQKFACNKYCLEADPEFDAHYGIWLDSPAGQAAGRPPKKDAI